MNSLDSDKRIPEAFTKPRSRREFLNIAGLTTLSAFSASCIARINNPPPPTTEAATEEPAQVLEFTPTPEHTPNNEIDKFPFKKVIYTPSYNGDGIYTLANSDGSNSKVILADIKSKDIKSKINSDYADSEKHYEDPVWSPTGDKFLMPINFDGWYTVIKIFDENGNFIKEVADEEGTMASYYRGDPDVRWLPDGKRFLKDGVMYSVESDEVRLLVNVGGNTLNNSFLLSPDGQKLAFVNHQHGYNFSVKINPSIESDPEFIVVDEGSSEIFDGTFTMNWSGDSRYLFYGWEGYEDIYDFHEKRSLGLKPLNPDSFFNTSDHLAQREEVCLSYDGHKIAYTCSAHEPFSFQYLMIEDLLTGEVKGIQDPNSIFELKNLQWSKNGDRLSFLSDDWIQDTSGNTPEEAFNVIDDNLSDLTSIYFPIEMNISKIYPQPFSF